MVFPAHGSTNWDSPLQTYIDGADTTNANAIAAETTRATAAEGLAAQKANNLSDLANAGTARTNLGLAIGTNVEAWSARLDTLAGTTDTGTGAIVRGTSPALTTPTGIVKSDVGLGNVDNTSDVNKPISTAQALVNLFPAAQDVARRGSSAGAARITTALQYDMVIGDSFARGSGAGSPGTSDWASLCATIESRLAGQPDPGPGMILCNDTTAFPYTWLLWSSLTVGAAGTTGPSAGNGSGGNTTPNTNWVLSSSGQTIGDTRTFRRVKVFYEKQASSAANIQISVDGGSTWSADQSTTGSGYGVYTSADLTYATSRTMQVKTTSAGTARIIGYIPFQTAATTGVVTVNTSKGGTQASDWTANRGWETLLALLTPRRLSINLGTNDERNAVSASTFQTNLATIVSRAQTASPNTTIEIQIPYYGDLASPTGVGNTTWASTWVPVYKTVAQTYGCFLVNDYDRFGNCASGVDPYSLTVEGLHFNDDGQRARAEHYLEKRSWSKAIPVATSPTFTGIGTFTDGVATDGMVTVGSGNFLGAALASVSVYGNTGDAKAVAQLLSTNGTPSMELGPGGSTATDVKLTRTGTGAATATGTWTLPAPIFTTTTTLNFTGGGSITQFDAGTSSPTTQMRRTSSHTNPDIAIGFVAGAPGIFMGDPSTDAVTDVGFNRSGAAAVTAIGTWTLPSPVISGHATIEGVTPTGATGTGKMVFDTAPSFTTSTSVVVSGGGNILSTDSGSNSPSLQMRKTPADTNADINIGYALGAPGVFLGDPAADTATDAGFNRSGAAAVSAIGTWTFTAPVLGAATGTSLAVTGKVTSSGTAGVGYATGAGGTVTQGTSKATAFTLSKTTGTITFNGAALAANTNVTSTWTNTTLAATDIVVFMHISGGTLGAYNLTCTPGSGTATVNLRNVTGGSLSEAPVFAFAVIKGVTA